MNEKKSQLFVILTDLLGSLPTHDGHEGQHSRARACLGRCGNSAGKSKVWRSFRQELARVRGIGFIVVKIWCGFAERGGCAGGHGCMGQRGGPACGDSGRNVLLEHGSLLLRASCEAAPANLPARRLG